ncbi:MAG: hypothetical protein Q8P61_01000 [Candidatus Nanopelagicales bacterium]|nr:hypothetical protein [Candidatus Nanopelagicales bacterium]
MIDTGRLLEPVEEFDLMDADKPTIPLTRSADLLTVSRSQQLQALEFHCAIKRSNVA